MTIELDKTALGKCLRENENVKRAEAETKRIEDLKADKDFFDKQANFTKQELARFRKMKVLILSPIMMPQPKWIRSLANMMALSWHFGLRIEKMGITEGMVVDWAREALAEEAVKDRSYIDGEPFTHFLWLDADQTFDPDMALILARHDLDAVSAMYYARSGDILPVAYITSPNDPDGFRQYPILEIPPALWEVHAFGFGACLIKREVFEKTPRPWFTLDWRCGEDFAFCRAARKAGFKFYVDGAYKIGHIAPGAVIGEAEALKYRQEHPELDDKKVEIRQGE